MSSKSFSKCYVKSQKVENIVPGNIQISSTYIRCPLHLLSLNYTESHILIFCVISQSDAFHFFLFTESYVFFVYYKSNSFRQFLGSNCKFTKSCIFARFSKSLTISAFLQRHFSSFSIILPKMFNNEFPVASHVIF